MVPRPADLGLYVKDESMAIVLGKALFWEQSAGGDGLTACATCHHAAGADSRVLNTVHPGPNGLFDTTPLATSLDAADFPVRTGDIVGSQGVQSRDHVRVRRGPRDVATVDPSPVFLLQRQVTGRNSPPIVNAIFNELNFWDGRANRVFNGQTPAGPADAGALVLRSLPGGAVALVPVALDVSSAASQAVGPPNNSVEMSADGRSWRELGKKLLVLRPLGQQTVHPTDSVLGPWRNAAGNGLSLSYAALIRAAFQDDLWSSNRIFDADRKVIGTGTPVGLHQFSQMEHNFALFWGIAIQLYEATQVSDDSRFDRFARGTGTLTAQELLGLDVFRGEGRCDKCHNGPLFTAAAITAQDTSTDDEAFTNTAVRPVGEDPGRSNGEFKTPGLRNVELNGPYFHNGGYLSLRQVVDFYDRGGDFPSGFTHGDVRQLGLSETEKNALVAFMLTLTDERVRRQAAPFDHPSLRLPNGTDLPATGAAGGAALQPYLGVSPFDPGIAALQRGLGGSVDGQSR